MRKVSDHRWEMRARGPVSLDRGQLVNASRGCEEGNIRLRSAKPKMPTVCKALRVATLRDGGDS